MGRKIVVCGKGGCGKTSITVLMANLLSRKGYKVDVIDADESNPSLHLMLGVRQPRTLIEYLGGRRSVSSMMKKDDLDLTEALRKAMGGISIGNLPDDYVSTSETGVRLVVSGKISDFFEGCACPIGYLTRVLVKNLVLEEDEHVLIDTDAGIEHVGRGLEEGVDLLLAVVDPTYDSILIAQKVSEVASKLGKEFWAVMNRVSPEVEETVTQALKSRGVRIAGKVGYDAEVFRSNLAGGPLKASNALKDIENILGVLGLA